MIRRRIVRLLVNLPLPEGVTTKTARAIVKKLLRAVGGGMMTTRIAPLGGKRGAMVARIVKKPTRSHVGGVALSKTTMRKVATRKLRVSRRRKKRADPDAVAEGIV